MQHYHRACGWHAWLNKQAATKLSSLIPGTTDRGQELLITDRLKDASLSLLYRDTDGNDKCIDLVKEAIMHVTYRSKSVTHCRLVTFQWHQDLLLREVYVLPPLCLPFVDIGSSLLNTHVSIPQ